MITKAVEALKIIEVPYDETKPMWEVFFEDEGGINKPAIKSYITKPEGRRELDDYKTCGVYLTAGIPFDVTQIVSTDTQKPHEEQIHSISNLTAAGLKAGNCVVMTGGGCSHAIGVVGGLQKALGKNKKIGFIWLDAHGDFNTPETSNSGLLGGMPLATIAGLCHGEVFYSWMDSAGMISPLKHSNIILSDGRDMDPEEAKTLKSTEIVYINTESFNNPDKWKHAVENLAKRVDVIYLHIDGDIMDEKYTPGQYTAVSGGPEVETVMNNINTVMETNKVIAFSLVSIFHENNNPCKELCTLNGMRIVGTAFSSWKYCPKI
jgi:arginase